MDDLKGVRIVDRERGVQLAATADLVAFGGGPLMAIDETADMLAIFEAAKGAGRKTLVAGCGVGPLGAPWHDEAITQLLKLADARIYRDEKSRRLAAKLGVDASADQVAEDPAFTWLAKHRQALDQTMPQDEGKVLLLGLRDFPYVTYARHLSEAQCLDAKQTYESAVLEALSRLVAQHPKLVIRPLPMCTNHFGDDDRWFYRRLFRGNALLTPHLDLSLLGAELAPLAYCEAFTQATAALTMRFHSVVFALGLEVPTVAIDYTLGQGKVHALAERFGVPHRSLAELDADFIFQEVSRLLEAPLPQAPGLIPSFPQAIQNALPALGFAADSAGTPT
jgi:polysaccharide pyruvyl transferase WcaK-like protein